MHPEILRPAKFWILALTVSFPAVLAVLFTPALPALAVFFHISEKAAQSSMTTYLLGYALGMLIYGPLANRWGRKIAMHTGFVLALVGTLLSLWVGVMEQFVLFCAMRFVQGLGASSGMKVSMTMVADAHAGKRATRSVSYLILAATLVPAFGLGIGGTLTTSFGWEGCFAFMAIYVVVLIGLICLLPETSPGLNREAIQVKSILHGYKRQFSDSFLVLHALMTGLCTSCYYFYTTEGPYIGIGYMGLSPEAYGWLALIPVFGMAGGCLIAAKLAGKQMPRITMISGLILAIIGVIVMAVCFGNGVVSIFSFFLIMIVIQAGVYIISPTALSVALLDATDKSNASAASQFINFGTSFVAVLILSLFPAREPIILPLLIGGALIAILMIWLKLKAHHERMMRSH